MSDDVQDPAEAGEDEPKKSGGKGLIIGVVGALLLGGGGFYATYSGMLFGGGDDGGEEHAKEEPVEVLPPIDEIAFVPIEKLVVSLGTKASATHLQFSAELEVSPANQEQVMTLMPRILDVLNTYLRAVDEKDLESPSAMIRLRAQMLRRVQIVTGDGLVNDLLITEFVLN